ncbi:hypothetical protein BDD14_0271 [Edaphobacter modestus]|uniref:Uncharacterized protein n=1 Tax=Edaphobacter modestus TaxID=388466 RepID=A0A4V2G3Z3_9BACT|nr:hypothetical protein BDD14_0271 [Edaphobacter modestus]
MVLRSSLYATVLTCLVLASFANAEGRLQVTYSNKGLPQLSYKGVVLEDLNRFPDDTLHIFHMKMTDSSGTLRSSGQYGWGENNSCRAWELINHIWTYHFVWGSIRVGFSQHDDSWT